jgi:hypothetical protein
MALFYITIGALMTWSGVWFYYLRAHSTGDGVAHYVCMGCLVTGLVLLAIGFTLGPMAAAGRTPPDGGHAASVAAHPAERDGLQRVTSQLRRRRAGRPLGGRRSPSVFEGGLIPGAAEPERQVVHVAAARASGPL